MDWNSSDFWNSRNRIHFRSLEKNINFRIFTSIKMSEVTEEVPKETIPEVEGDSQKQEVCF